MSPLSQYVQALDDTLNAKIKNNLLQPISFERGEHRAQAEDQILAWGGCAALAVVEEGTTRRDKACQCWSLH